MKSVSEILEAMQLLKSNGILRSVKSYFLAPTFHIDVVGDEFLGREYDDRIAVLDSYIEALPGFQGVGLLDHMSRLPLVVTPLAVGEESGQTGVDGAEASWVSSFLGGERKRICSEPVDLGAKYIHFYGYKGGQGRSTVLAMLAEVLANDGYRVLVVDADIEAPSLDLFFGAAADSYSQTLMGLCGWAEEITPISGVYAGRTGGRIDILPCRPRSVGTDLDFALLVAVAPLDAGIYEQAAQRLRDAIEVSEVGPYDVVMIDHRTGIASSVLPLMQVMAGGSVIFARTDFNTSSLPSELKKVVQAIIGLTSPLASSAFVGFSLDPNRRAGAGGSDAEARVREELLNLMLDASINTEGESASPSELGIGWVDWYLDRALLSAGLPDVEKLQSDNLASLASLRELLSLPVGRREMSLPEGGMDLGRMKTSVSGAKDGGVFIHIPEIESLFISGNPYSYILGRKGTGKTRLLKEMSLRGLGVPILVAADENSTGGLQSQSIEADEWLVRCNYEPSVFWWSLIHVAIDNSSKRNMAEILAEKISQGIDPAVLASRTEVKAKLISSLDNYVFLVDGLETLVSSERIKGFVGALFEVLGSIQNDSSIARKLVVRVFVREDLASDVMQNVEQQMEGRNIRLKWSATAILNFAISRIPTLKWIGEKYISVCEDIQSRWSEIERSALSEVEATELLLRIFPSRLRRNNLSTSTFLKLYFSDAGGDDNSRSTFYPRLYLSFLQRLDRLAASSTNPTMEDGRLDSSLLNQAYDEASGDFINETKQELSHLLSLRYDSSDHVGEDDSEKVAKFVSAFDGLGTPFVLEALIADLQGRTNFTQKSIRESLQKMKAIRMFEDRPGYAGWWRVGQLYKRGLRMKYVRSSLS